MLHASKLARKGLTSHCVAASQSHELFDLTIIRRYAAFAHAAGHNDVGQLREFDGENRTAIHEEGCDGEDLGEGSD